MDRSSTAVAVEPSACSGRNSDDTRIGVVPCGEERKALEVVPVQMREQDRAGEGPAVQERGGGPQARAGVEYQGRRLGAVVVHRDAGGVSPVAHEISAGCRGGPPHPAEVESHRRSAPRGLLLVLSLAAVAPGELVQVPAFELIRLHRSDPAAGSPQRASRSACRLRGARARRASRRGRTRPVALPSCSTRSTPSRSRKTSDPRRPAAPASCRPSRVGTSASGPPLISCSESCARAPTRQR